MVIAAPNYQFPEDVPHVSGDRGTAALVVRKDIEGSLCDIDNDYTLLQVNATGSLRVIGSVTQLGAPWAVSGTVNVIQGTTPWVVSSNDLDIRDLNCVTDSVSVCQITSPWVVSGTVELGSTTLSALETITVLQGTSPWVVSGTVTADTELPSASPLADDDPNPTTSRIGANLLGFDGSAWDRLRTVGTGTLLIEQGNASTASTPSNTVTGAAAIVLATNASRRSFTIQNTGTVVVYIAYGGTNPTGTSYHFALAPGIIAHDGRGAFIVEDQWSGDVRAFSSSAGSIAIMEIT